MQYPYKGDFYVFIRSVISWKHFTLSYTFFRKFKSTAHWGCFSDTCWTPFPPTGPQTQLSESREHLLTSTELILRFPFLQHISYNPPSENRDSNNLLWCSKQQRLLLEKCAGLRAERTSTNSICLFWHTGRKEEPDSPEVVKNDSPAWNSEWKHCLAPPVCGRAFHALSGT